MQTIKITTSQNIDIDYAVAGLGDRIVASLIDYGILLVLYLLCLILTLLLNSVVHFNKDTSLGIPVSTLVTVFIWLIFYVFYDLASEIFMGGQSVGKKIVKIKVISLDGARPQVRQYLLRWIFRIVDIGITSGSAAIITIALTDNKQRIGDLIAGTAVISLKPESDLKNVIFGQPPAGYQPVYSEVSQLTDSDITLIYDVIKNFTRTRNSMLVYKLAVQIKSYLNISHGNEINEYQFLEIILNDYHSLAAKSAV